MELTKIIFIALMAWMAWMHLRPGRGGRGAHRPDTEPDTQVRRIRVKGAYQPSEVHVRAGSPARLIFRREETAACSECVVFPDLGISVMLPPFEDIAIDLPACAPGEHPFTCQMRMLHGKLIVDAAAFGKSVNREAAAR